MSLSKIWFFKLLSLTKLAGLVGVTALRRSVLLCCTIQYCSVKVNKNLSRRPPLASWWAAAENIQANSCIRMAIQNCEKRSRRHLFYDYSVAILYYSITEFTVYENHSKKKCLIKRNNILIFPEKSIDDFGSKIQMRHFLQGVIQP